MRKQLAAVGLTAGLGIGAAAGFAFTSGTVAVGAQDDPAATTTAPSATSPAAPDAERPDRSARLQEILEPLVEDGTITQAQADKVAEALLAAKPDRGDGPRGGFGKRAIGIGIEAAAEALGITTDELRTELRDGASVADVAEEKGVELSKVTDALVAEARTRLDQQVADGKITQAQADERLTKATERITAMVNGELPEGGPGRGPGRGPGGWGHGPKGGADREAPTTTEG